MNIKRIVDFLGALILFILLSPAFWLIAIAVYFTSGMPVFFRQLRPGLNGKPFLLYKFRTMTDACDVHGNLLDDCARLTRLGSFLRSTSLDELPEFFNVFNGEMSLVGPRPLLMHYLNLYNSDQARRHEVKPGITGWAQINGRNAIGWDEKFRLDVWYVENQSLYLDLKILAMTIMKILSRENINKGGHETVTAFKGSV